MRGTILYAALGALGIACVRPDKAPPASDTTASRADTAASSPAAAPPPAPAPVPAPAPTATKVATVQGFLAPESVLHDSTQDIYFVSNITGSPMAKDNNGFISRVRPDGAVENLKFIEGGRSGVTLNAPKGLALEGDTLWVADIDVVRAFDAKTGAAIDTVSLSKLGAVFLNDIVVGLSGALYITDTGIRFDDVGNVLHPGPDRVFRVGPDRAVTQAIRGDTLGRPNGIAVDPVAAGESNGDLAVAVASTQHTPHCRRGGGPFPRGVILAISAEPHTRSEVLRVRHWRQRSARDPHRPGRRSRRRACRPAGALGKAAGLRRRRRGRDGRRGGRPDRDGASPRGLDGSRHARGR